MTTALGALINYLFTAPKPAPSSINFGLLPAPDRAEVKKMGKDRKRSRKILITKLARESFHRFYEEVLRDSPVEVV